MTSEKTENKAIHILQAAKRSGIVISVDNSQLSIKYSKGVNIEPNLLEEIKNNKDLIIDFLNHKKSKLKKLTESKNQIRQIVKDPTEHIPPSFSQERLWFIDQLEGSIQYHSTEVWRSNSVLNKEALSYALQTLIDRHEVLRTVFLEQEGKIYQTIMDTKNWQLEIIDGSMYTQNRQGLKKDIQNLIRQPFDLSKDYMVRAHLITLCDQEQILIVTTHHIATDGWSFSILVKEVVELYNAYIENRPAKLTPLAIQYSDYAIWQRNYLQGEIMDEKVGYWKDKLKGVGVLQLPTDHPRPSEWSNRGASLEFNIDKLLSDQLQTLSRQEGATLFMTLLVAFKILLHRYSGQEDICVGSPIANRTQEEIEGLIGFFVNTLALRSEVKSGSSFIELLQQVKATTMEAYEHQDVPFEKVVEVVVKERDMSRNPLFQVMLGLQNTPKVERLRLGGVQLSVEEIVRDTAQFDIAFFITETTDGLQVTIKYATDLYTEATIIRMINHFKMLLDSIVAAPQQKIGELTMLTKAEEQQLVYEFNDTAVDYPKDKTVVDLFEEQATKTPTAIAVVFEGEQFSYKQLNERANQLAHYLTSKGVKAETLVPICIERSLEMIVGILGILKAGGAYVPIDPEYPEERIKFMLEDSNAKVILSSSQSSQKLSTLNDLIIIELDSQWVKINEQPTDNLPAIAAADNLAYVIYTSGSTGNPKGVMNEHGGLMNRLCWAQDYYSLTVEDSVLQKTTYCFDVSVWELLWPLLAGSRLVFARPDGHKDTGYLRSLIDSENITMLHFVPSMLEVFLFDLQTGECQGLRKVLCSGEALKPKQVELFTEKLPHAELHNLYGPTEAAIDVTYWRIPDRREVIGVVPIGKPVSNTQIYILGGNNDLMPVGVPGEINIGGIQVSRGYLNRPELTQEKFVKDPFKEDKARIYKTGDLGRWLSDGNIEYLGRKDDQVKIRGYRIELGEIESILQQCDVVNQGVVMAREDSNGNRRLVGYVVPEGVFNKEAIVSYLRNKLPEYMVPALWVKLESLPLTSNGKADRKALPDPDVSEQINDQYLAPRNKLEIILADIWKKLLGIERVGIYDNFFEVGGHSLLAMRIISAIRKELQVELAIRDIFQYTTINDLSEHIKSEYEFGKETDLISLDHPLSKKISSFKKTISFDNQIGQVARDPTQHIPLSFSQERLWFIDQLEGSVQYHSPSVWRLKGQLQIESLSNTLQALIDRHEVLRTVFLEEEGKVYQSIIDSKNWRLKIIDGSNYNKDQKNLKNCIQDLISQPFDLSKDYMLRADLVTLSNQENILIVTIHHIASDGWSTSILVTELMEFSNANVEGRPLILPPLPIQYADYAIWQRNYLTGEILDKKLRYWKNKLDGVAMLELPSDYHRSNELSNRGAWLEFNIDKLLSDELQTLSMQERTTLFMTLLAAFKVLLHRYSGQEDICIGSPIANRTQKEVEGLIGFFINTLALRNDVKSRSSFTELLQQVKVTTLEAYEYQDVPFEKVVEVLVKERDMSRNPLFQVMMVLQNTPKADIFSLAGAQLSVEEFEHNTAQFDITFFITETADGLKCSINYAIDLYNEATISRMVDHFKMLLSSIVKNPQQKIGELKMLTAAEEHQLLVEFNDTKADYPKDKTIVVLFEEQAVKTPEAIAVIFEEEHLTYKQLNEKANQLAQYLISKGVKEETLVPIYIERSLEMIIGILAILKSGGAYVPMDPEYPEDRINFMLEDSNAKVILSSSKSSQKLPADKDRIIVEIDSEWPYINEQPTNNLPAIATPQNLAYVIYTSGSTGKPKGVMIEHCNVSSFIYWCKTEFLHSNFEVVYAGTSVCFDLSIFEIFYPLSIGKCFRIIENGLYIGKYLSGERNVLTNTVPSVIQSLLNDGLNLRNISVMNMAGEPIPIQVQQRLDADKIEIRNLYGPTEDTTYSTIYRLKNGEPAIIGWPINNTQIYIVNKQMKLVPIGLTGEICIGGAGLARGYLNRADLTSEKFILNPFSAIADARLYKTGDLGRWLPEGNIEYLRRMDDQVKIRGYRIELGEIESILQQCEGVAQGVVLAREDSTGNKRLVGYVVPKSIFDKDAVIAELRKKLPEYMVPALWIELESLPLTPNGKIDRRALPDPDVSQHVTGQYTKPTNELEIKLVNIWKELLGIENIGINNNFFELGGHSLLAMRVLSAIRQELKVELRIKDIFQYTTIKDLSKYIDIQTNLYLDKEISEFNLFNI